jgi:NADPH:quinone reductase-like Zn-dependent oxidoreductase
MKAIRIHEFGGAEELRLEEIKKRDPKAGEVLIKMQLQESITPISRCETDSI